MRRSHRITEWDPEDPLAWEAGNQVIARRNLIWSIATVHLGYSVWSLWSVMVLFMPKHVYGFSAGDKFLLGTTATLVGACLRLPYSMAALTFGSRNWTIFSAFVLLIPTGGTMLLLAHPGLPLWPYLVCAALTGLGGGNFAASTTNANALYPHRLKGSALGLTGGAGNLGVPIIQVVGLVVIAIAGNRQPYWVCAVYLVLVTIVGIGATVFLDHLEQHRINPTCLRSILSSILSHRDTWLLALLYLGTFGSFIGFAFAFGHVLQISFIAGGQSPAQASLHAAQVAFVGPLLASLARIYGGRLADRLGGGRVTLAVFAAMVVAAGLLAAISTLDDHNPGPAAGPAMTSYMVAFIVLFILSGIGNASVYKMIPTVFEACSHTLDGSGAERRRSRARSGMVSGFVAAFGALGGSGINLAMRQSYLCTGTGTPAFWMFTAFYVAAAILTWMVYVRQPVIAHPL
ncbi:MFS transporter [Mycobacterium noviomagense]|uniref:MFS transporter n=1 Tax=Mycobacterium noviomagense TaxID=459858 RepID=A0A7I7PJH0_9MYCO|nr:nitrate/nitrite transporter [Mycobacterium noviomagense]ORB11695.1 MFS transporter [Mycobacterium noviomagense]BBY08682.1 MFS transporter [Mycobacterium noviomagense]